MKRKVVVNDKMQKGYVYCRTEPAGRCFAPGFEPQLTPKRMLELGVFGGKYRPTVATNFRRAGSPAPSCAPSGTIRALTISE